MPRTENRDCGICGRRPGRLHKPSCECEECPFCHQQLMDCDCCYILLKIDPEKEPVHSKGLDEKQGKAWYKLLRQKGLIRVGSEIRHRAAENWTDTKRKEAVAAIAIEMVSAAKDHKVNVAEINRFSERLTALVSKSSVFLEMNKNHILRGDPIEWNPPSK